MGNYISCTLAGAPGGKHSRATKVIFPSGEIRQFHEPIKAAELMLETPNFFLVNSRSLHIGRRFSALNADEDLEMANVYVMFPMKRVKSVVSAADMGVLFLTANSTANQSVSSGKVRFLVESGNAPNMVEERITSDERQENEAAHDVEVPKLNLDNFEEFSTPEFMHRLSMCRSKKPVLDTIAEDRPIYSSSINR